MSYLSKALIPYCLALGFSSCGSRPETHRQATSGQVSPESGSKDADKSREREPNTGSNGPIKNGTASEFFPNAEKEMASKRIFRLTQVQFDQTIKYALPGYSIPSIHTLIALDPKQNNYDYSDFLTINAANFAPYSQWVDAIGATVAKDSSLLIACAAKPVDVGCHKKAAQQFVQKAFRGAASEADIALYVDFYLAAVAKGPLSQAVSQLITNVLMSPSFIYRSEFSTDNESRLLSGETLQNLSYTLADAPLSDLVGQGDKNPDLNQAVEVALNSPLARAKLKRFLMDWLEIKKVSDYRISKEKFPLFTEAVATAAINETSQYLDFHLTQPSPKLSELVNSRKAFVTEALKNIYESDKGRGTDPSHDPERRLGLFTQSALIASHSGPIESNVIKRGVFFMRKVMCLETGAVPPGAEIKLPVGENLSERERVEAGTQIAPCIACHAKINPFGFAFENFDAIGRWRTEDNNRPVNANVSMAFLGDTMTSTTNPVEALSFFVKTDRFKQCFVRQVFRYYMGRDELVSDDPLLKEMYQHLIDKDEDILGLLKTMVKSKRFDTRK